MSRAELLQQVNFSGQVFPLIQHVTVYPSDVSLHVAWNLRVIEAHKNRAKSNRMEVE